MGTPETEPPCADIDTLGAILFITIMIVVKVFSFNLSAMNLTSYPPIKQVADHSWLPNDWYLNINTTYRQLFGFLFGPLISRLGFETGAYLGRIIEWLLIAIAIYVFFKTLHLRPWFGILVLILFRITNPWSPGMDSRRT